MIHDMLAMLSDSLPLYPPIVVALSGVLLSVLALWLFGRSRGTILFAAAALLLALGLVVGLVGFDRPAISARWGEVEDLAEDLIGPRSFRKWEQVTAVSILLAAGLLYVVYSSAFSDKPGERARRQLGRDAEQGQALGSAHLCGKEAFRRWRRHDPWGWTLQGRFWGAKGQRLGDHLSLNGEDIARGVAVFGPQGSGKTQCVILPAIADRMRDGHSLVVTDVQGELQPYI